MEFLEFDKNEKETLDRLGDIFYSVSAQQVSLMGAYDVATAMMGGKFTLDKVREHGFVYDILYYQLTLIGEGGKVSIQNYGYLDSAVKAISLFLQSGFMMQGEYRELPNRINLFNECDEIKSLVRQEAIHYTPFVPDKQVDISRITVDVDDFIRDILHIDPHYVTRESRTELLYEMKEVLTEIFLKD